MNVQEIAKEALIRKFEKMSVEELIQYVEKRDIMSRHSTAVTRDYWATQPTTTCDISTVSGKTEEVTAQG